MSANTDNMGADELTAEQLVAHRKWEPVHRTRSTSVYRNIRTGTIVVETDNGIMTVDTIDFEAIVPARNKVNNTLEHEYMRYQDEDLQLTETEYSALAGEWAFGVEEALSTDYRNLSMVDDGISGMTVDYSDWEDIVTDVIGDKLEAIANGDTEFKNELVNYVMYALSPKAAWHEGCDIAAHVSFNFEADN